MFDGSNLPKGEYIFTKLQKSILFYLNCHYYDLKPSMERLRYWFDYTKEPTKLVLNAFDKRGNSNIIMNSGSELDFEKVTR